MACNGAASVPCGDTGMCVLEAKVCDGRMDCPNGFDERICGKLAFCTDLNLCLYVIEGGIFMELSGCHTFSNRVFETISCISLSMAKLYMSETIIFFPDFPVHIH